ncbi:MAG: MucR family transcriptional regulator [Haloferacaceae archaeon]
MTVKHKHDAFADTREEFARAQAGFDQYADGFWSDVQEKRRHAEAFGDEAAELRSAFERVLTAFDEYAAAFEDDVAARHDAAGALREEMAATRDAFAAALAEFDAYAERFDRAVDAKRRAATRFREEATATRDAFEGFAEAFDADVEERRRAVETLLDAVEALRAEYDQAAESLSEAVVEFYGYEEPAADDAGASSSDEAPTAETVPESDDATADDEIQEDMVGCQVCGEYYQAITESHLQTHDMSMQEYKDEYGPDATIYPGEE